MIHAAEVWPGWCHCPHLPGCYPALPGKPEDAEYTSRSRWPCALNSFTQACGSFRLPND